MKWVIFTNDTNGSHKITTKTITIYIFIVKFFLKKRKLTISLLYIYMKGEKYERKRKGKNFK